MIFAGEGYPRYFGASVAGGGDINCDGYDDFCVGANGEGEETGRVYIYFGGKAPDTIPDLVLTGSAGEEFGAAVATGADVNGDGGADIIIGAPQYSPSPDSVQIGRAYLFYSCALLGGTPVQIYTGEQAGDLFGSSVAIGWDANVDIFSEIVVGAIGFVLGDDPPGSEGRGRCYVYQGDEAPPVTPRYVLTGEHASDQFGYSLAMSKGPGGGLLIGAPAYDDPPAPPETNFGGASLYPGVTLASVEVHPGQHSFPRKPSLITHLAYPNPASTTVRFDMDTQPATTVAVLQIADLHGRVVARRFLTLSPSGHASTTWDGTSWRGEKVADGLYVYSLRAGSASASGHVVLLHK